MTTETAVTQRQIEAQRQAVDVELKKLHELQSVGIGEAVENATFSTTSGTTTLSELFGDYTDLIVVHNMGPACAYCTMWADSFSSQLPYVADRAAFVVVNGELPDDQQRFAERRGWTFTMVSDENSDGAFTRDMGFLGDDGRMPGVSTFTKQADGTIVRNNRDWFGPNDPYLGTWHFFSLLPGGPADFQATFQH